MEVGADDILAQHTADQPHDLLNLIHCISVSCQPADCTALSDFSWSGRCRDVQGEAGSGDEAVEGVCPVLEAFESITDKRFQAVEGYDGEVGQARLTCAHTPSTGLRSGSPVRANVSRARFVVNLEIRAHPRLAVCGGLDRGGRVIENHCVIIP
ncbi:hypothetical protein GCM10010216_54000 [Streptomyces flaveolus]|nr:hypothetical protein GCM10010216_54000 [Streptomyces flaveolus]